MLRSGGDSNELVLSRHQLVDRRLHRLDSTPRAPVNRRSLAGVAAALARARNTSCAKLSAVITAMRSIAGDLAGVADLAHRVSSSATACISSARSRLLARDLELATEDRDVERDRLPAAGFALIRRAPSRAARRGARSRRTHALVEVALAAPAPAEFAAQVSFAARNARVRAISAASAARGAAARRPSGYSEGAARASTAPVGGRRRRAGVERA